MARHTALSVVVSAIDKITAPMQKINRSIEKLTAPIRRVNRSLSQLNRAAGLDKFIRNLKSARGHVGNVARSLGGVLRKITLVGGVAAGAGLALINSFANAGDKIDKTARRLGFGTAALQEWQHVAELNGVSQDLFNNSLSAFGKRLGEAKAGTGGLTTLLKRVSPALLEQLKNTDSVEEAFNLYITAVGKIQDESKKAALTSAAFSRAGLPLTNIMNAGSKAIANQRREKRRLGIIDKAGIKAAADYKDQMFQLGESFAGVRNVVVGKLLPVINVLIGRLTGLIVELRPEIEKWAKGFAANLPQRLQRLWRGFKQVLAAIKPLIDFGRSLAQSMGVVKTVLGALALLVGGSLVSALWSAGLAIKALNLGLLATPVGWILAAIAAIAVAVFLIIKNWQPIKAFFKTLWDDVTAVFSRVVNNISGFFTGLWEGVTTLFDNGVKFLRDKLLSITDILPEFVKEQLGLDTQIAASINTNQIAGQLLASQTRSESIIKVQFDNAPRGTRVDSVSDNNTALNLDLGFSMVTP